MSVSKLFSTLTTLLVLLFALTSCTSVLINRDSSERKAFREAGINSEFAWNRDGYIVKVSEHMAIMKLNDDTDEIILVDDPDSTDFRWKVLLKREISGWEIQDNDVLRITVIENGTEKEEFIHTY